MATYNNNSNNHNNNNNNLNNNSHATTGTGTSTSRRGPNMASYLRNLNVQEPAADDTLMTEEDLQKELAMFTNTNFFDFDSGQNTDYQAAAAKPEIRVATGAVTEPHSATSTTADDVASPGELMGDFLSLDGFVANGGDFNFGDFSTTYASPTIPSFQDHLGSLASIQPNPQQQQTAYPPVPQQHQPGSYAPPPTPQLGPEGSHHKQQPSESSTHSQRPSPAMTFEEQSRRLAEEDKRRRNTAASARFRIKKKQREQALEKSAKEMTEKVTALEGRISTLETENKWLRSLVMEKHGSSAVSGPSGPSGGKTSASASASASSGSRSDMGRLLSLGNEELGKLLGRLGAKSSSDDGSDSDDGSSIVAKGLRSGSSRNGRGAEDDVGRRSDRKSDKKEA